MPLRLKRSVHAVLLAAIGTLQSCALFSHDPDFQSLSGTITYRQRIALVPESVVIVDLQEISTEGVHADTIAEERIERPGQVPVSFDLKYDAHAIRAGHRYAISAAIYNGRRLIFSTQAAQTVALRDDPRQPIQVVLDQVPAPPPLDPLQ